MADQKKDVFVHEHSSIGKSLSLLTPELITVYKSRPSRHLFLVGENACMRTVKNVCVCVCVAFGVCKFCTFYSMVNREEMLL